jgi:hypothetical protein
VGLRRVGIGEESSADLGHALSQRAGSRLQIAAHKSIDFAVDVVHQASTASCHAEHHRMVDGQARLCSASRALSGTQSGPKFYESSQDQWAGDQKPQLTASRITARRETQSSKQNPAYRPAHRRQPAARGIKSVDLSAEA